MLFYAIPHCITCTSSGRWWGAGKSDVLQSIGSQRGGHELATEQQPLQKCVPLPWHQGKVSLSNRLEKQKNAHKNKMR